MYFNGKLEIDPSQITVYKKVKPTKLFGRLVDVLTFGAATPKQELETFTAVSILQQLNMGLRSINIHNVVRLAVDDYDFYLDEKGIDDDLDIALLEFKTKIDPLESEFFNTIYMVCEHNDAFMKYLIEISVTRRHKIGEYPIKVIVNGVVSDLKLDDQNNVDVIKNKISEICSSQQEYDNFIDKHKINFNRFLSELELALQKFIRVDDVIIKSDMQLLRPSKAYSKPDEMPHDRYGEPIHYGYFGFDSYIFYSALWTSLLYQNPLMIADAVIVDSLGNPVFGIGGGGMMTGGNNVFNPDLAFEPPQGDFDYYSGNEYDTIISDSGLSNEEDDFMGEDSADSNWLDISGDTGDDSDAGSCSSCGSCSN